MHGEYSSIFIQIFKNAQFMRGFVVDSGRTVADSPQALWLTPHFLFTPLFSPPSQRLTGKVKFYHRRKGYGFIIPIDAANETNGVFVHRTSIYKRDLVFPDEGEVVTYEITNDESGTYCHCGTYLFMFVPLRPLFLARLSRHLPGLVRAFLAHHNLSSV
jgi:cold shock CspA family protein